MIKCPKCGSTSQIKTIYAQNINDKTILTKYNCICGTDFFMNMKLNILQFVKKTIRKLLPQCQKNYLKTNKKGL